MLSADFASSYSRYLLDLDTALAAAGVDLTVDNEVLIRFRHQTTSTWSGGRSDLALDDVSILLGPSVPAIVGIVDDTGIPDDGITRATNLLIHGTAKAFSSIEVFQDGGSIGSTSAGGDGSWVFDHTATTLPEGSFALTARATGAYGNVSGLSEPFSVTIDTTPPATAAVTSADVDESGTGQSVYEFTIQFTDNVAVDVDSLDDHDVMVTGPDDFSQNATFVSVTPEENGTPRTGTYRIIPPGGSWYDADNGTYTIVLNADQVFDIAGNAVPGAPTLATFLVTAGPLPSHVDVQLVAVAAPSAGGSDELPSGLETVSMGSTY